MTDAIDVSVGQRTTMGVAASILADVLGFARPGFATAEPSDDVARALGRADRALVVAPDAMGDHLWRRRPDLRNRFAAAAPVEVVVTAPQPSVTPVCYSTTFTGGGPDRHGITRYEKPVLTCDTVFDAAHRGGRRVAVVAVADSSIDLLFRRPFVDHIPQEDDAAVVEATVDVLDAGEHDLVVAYLSSYDDFQHRHGPFGDEAVAAAERVTAAVEACVEAARRAWAAHRWLCALLPDHGAHLRPDGRGDHDGSDPVDLEVTQFYGVTAPVWEAND